MNIKLATLVAGATLAATTALATPQYTGNTFGSEINGPSVAPGYYIWNDEANPYNWSIRWTSPGVDESDNVVDWAGNIQFWDSNLGTVKEFLFETSGIHKDTLEGPYYDLSVISGADTFAWTGATNVHGGVDGINFTLTDDVELMGFQLGSSLFADLENGLYDPGTDNGGIYIGSDFETTTALVFENQGMKYQKFEIHVPEPGSIALIGLGLAGLAASRRRQKGLTA